MNPVPSENSVSGYSGNDWSLMVPTRIIRRRNQDVLQKATEHVLAGASVKSIARSFNIPRSTLRNFMKRNGYVSTYSTLGRRRLKHIRYIDNGVTKNGK